MTECRKKGAIARYDGPSPRAPAGHMGRNARQLTGAGLGVPMVVREKHRDQSGRGARAGASMLGWVSRSNGCPGIGE